jgi:hypothetical protein
MPRKLNLAELKEVAAGRGGECLATVYRNAHTRVQWKCARGHCWWAIANAVRRGSWCPQCFHDGRRKSLPELQALASRKGGRLLSKRYRNSQTHIWWQCAQGHRWKAIANSVVRGSWCLRCVRSAPAHAALS